MTQTELYRRTPKFNDWRAVACGRHTDELLNYAEAHFGTQYQRHDLEVRLGSQVLARRHHDQDRWIHFAARSSGDRAGLTMATAKA